MVQFGIEPGVSSYPASGPAAKRLDVRRRRRAMAENPDLLLRAWFGDDLETEEVVAVRSQAWFGGEQSFDDLVRHQFSALPDRALRGDLNLWRGPPRSTLALTIALDQLPRNLFRSSPQAFAYDSAALELSRWALDRDLDGQLHPVEAVFLYLPLEHAEDLAIQVQCVARFRALLARTPGALLSQFESFLSYAERHRDVIKRFGRFPHRNQTLGRPSTVDELRYLKEGGDTFSGTEGAA
jgi:uncharacterized protein (DUF924 family)